jgi:hypothetical protein
MFPKTSSVPFLSSAQNGRRWTAQCEFARVRRDFLPKFFPGAEIFFEESLVAVSASNFNSFAELQSAHEVIQIAPSRSFSSRLKPRRGICTIRNTMSATEMIRWVSRRNARGAFAHRFPCDAMRVNGRSKTTGAPAMT